jgi:hypothetical protein
MPSIWDNYQKNQGLGSDQNGNQLTWQNQTNPPQPNSLGGYQQPSQPFQMPQWGPWGAVANNISGSKSYGFYPQQPATPGQGFVNAPQNLGGFSGFTQQKPPDMNIATRWTNPTSNVPVNKSAVQGQGYAQMRKELAPTAQTQQAKGYAQMRAEANMTSQQKQNQMYGQMRNAASGPNPKNGAFFQAAKNPLVLQAQAAAQKSFWSNAYQQLNAALRPVNLPLAQNNTGGGYGYGDWGYGYGGGGGGSRKYAENLPGAVWRMNQ